MVEVSAAIFRMRSKLGCNFFQASLSTNYRVELLSFKVQWKRMTFQTQNSLKKLAEIPDKIVQVKAQIGVLRGRFRVIGCCKMPRTKAIEFVFSRKAKREEQSGMGIREGWVSLWWQRKLTVFEWQSSTPERSSFNNAWKLES